MPEVSSIISLLSINNFVTLGAAFAGAALAFGLERYQRGAERIDNNVVAGTRALFVLGRMFDVLYQYQKEIIDPYRGKTDAWLNTDTQLAQDDYAFHIPFDDLTFVLRSSINARNELVLRELWPKMSDARIPVGAAVEEVALREFLGTALTRKLEGTIVSLTDLVDKEVISVMEAYEEVYLSLKRIYPKEEFLRFKFPDDSRRHQPKGGSDTPSQ